MDTSPVTKRQLFLGSAAVVLSAFVTLAEAVSLKAAATVLIMVIMVAAVIYFVVDTAKEEQSLSNRSDDSPTSPANEQ